MCQRIAASLASIALIVGAAQVQAESQPPTLPPGPAPQYPAAPYAGPASQPVLPTPAAPAPPLYGHPVPAPQVYPPVVGPIAPSAAATSECPGNFTIIANDHNTILLDTRDGTTWRLLNTADGTKWVELKRDQPRERERGRRPRGVATPVPASDASRRPDPFGEASPTADPFGEAAQPADPFGVDEPENQQRLKRRKAELREQIARQDEGVGKWPQLLAELEQQVRQHASEAKEAKERAGKSLSLIEALKKRNEQLTDEVAELKKKLSEADPQPRVSSEPVESKPAPLSE